MLINSQHLMETARFVPSPNCDERPDGVVMQVIVIHGISLPPGEFGGNDIEKLFTNCLDCNSRPDYNALLNLRVSSHLLIDRNGSLTQFVPFDKRAWHAGVSVYRGQTNCNDFSLGIELEGTDTIPYTRKQYRRLAKVTRALLKHYPALSSQDITTHSDIAPGRKTDPGPLFERDFLDRY